MQQGILPKSCEIAYTRALCYNPGAIGESLVPAQKLLSFFRQYKLHSYKKHETILRPYDTPSGVFYLQKGYVRDYSVSEEGEELTLIIFKPDDFFPMQWTINNKESTHTYEAITQVELLRAPKEEFLKFLKENPDVLFVLLSKIIVRMGGLLDRMEDLVFGNAGAKVASVLSILSERFGKVENGGVLIEVPLTHKDVASLIGITRETASLEMKKLKDLGLIGTNGRHVWVNSVKGLQNRSLLTEPLSA